LIILLHPVVQEARNSLEIAWINNEVMVVSILEKIPVIQPNAYSSLKVFTGFSLTVLVILKPVITVAIKKMMATEVMSGTELFLQSFVTWIFSLCHKAFMIFSHRLLAPGNFAKPAHNSNVFSHPPENVKR
jgi:hypothetical protein